MKIEVKDKPIESVSTDSGAEVLRFTEETNYSDPFGFEWEHYSQTYTDSTLGADLSKTRLELNLGFPLEFLKGMRVLEIGCGQGRFTEHLADYAEQVVAVDMSYAVYHNIALNKENVLGVRADLHKLPEFSDKFDLVFCRGVIQHTEDPIASIHRLFDYAKEDGLVVFDVYKKGRGRWTSFKFFWRPILQKTVSIESFNSFLNRHEDFLYNQHHRNMRVLKKMPWLVNIIARTPLYLSRSWEADYPNLTKDQRKEIAKNEMVDMLYSGYDQPMSPEEVTDTLAQIGKRAYSYDVHRNHFRCRNTAGSDPIKVALTKNGALIK